MFFNSKKQKADFSVCIYGSSESSIHGTHQSPLPHCNTFKEFLFKRPKNFTKARRKSWTPCAPDRRPAFFLPSMEDLSGLLRIHVRRGVNLAVRDVRSSDPYVVIRMGKQKLKTRVVKKNLNPEWNEDLTLSVTSEIKDLPIKLKVYDRDLFRDDEMGEADFYLFPLLEAVKMRLQGLPNGTIIMRVQPNRQNCLAEESCVRWVDGKIVQNVFLRLRNVECGEVELLLKWIDAPGGKGV